MRMPQTCSFFSDPTGQQIGNPEAPNPWQALAVPSIDHEAGAADLAMLAKSSNVVVEKIIEDRDLLI